MSALVPAEDIERIVGTRRRSWAHVGRAVSAEQTVYILHSIVCKNSGIDLRECPYSVALDAGIDLDVWGSSQDAAVALYLQGGRLLPGPVLA